MSVIKESLVGGGERAPYMYSPDPGTYGKRYTKIGSMGDTQQTKLAKTDAV